MSLFSKQQIFCNTCGKECFIAPSSMLGGGRTFTYRVCSMECLEEMRWREANSLINKEYVPWSHKDVETKDKNSP